MHACFVFGILLLITTLRFRILKVGGLLFSFFARHGRLLWNFQLFSSFFDGFLKFSISGSNACQSSSIIEFWLSRLPTLVFLSSERLYQFSSILLATHSQVWRLLELLSASLPDHMCPFGGFSFNKVYFVNPFQESDKLLFASTFRQSSKGFACITSRSV